MSITSSIHPKKQRKSLFNMPKHLRKKVISAPLSEELRNKYNVRSLPVKAGDTVKVVRGDNAGKEGKVTRVNRGNGWVFIEGLTREKANGTPTFIPIHASKVVITKLDLKDKERKAMIERASGRPVEAEEEKKEGEKQ
uniref:Large ribosomal subunit protein uL24 n=1 Tax=Fervidicoccus fontis TaxID=683846 RepID=A0A7J3SKP8_9CREN